MALVALVVYASVGLWLVHVGNYAIGDAVTRTANARTILFGRDPHLAAIGFVWMPLPVLVQLPLTFVLEPFGLSWSSGTLSTAFAGALTIPVLARIGLRMGGSRLAVASVVALYAFCPVTVFWAGSGMSETLLMLFLAIAASAYIRWSDSGDARVLGVLGLALGLATLTRYEGLLVAAVFAAAVTIRCERSKRVGALVTVALPSVFVFVVWLVFSNVLRNDALYWYRTLKIVGTPDPDASWLPKDRSLATSFQYAGERLLRFAPALLVIAPLAAWVDAKAFLDHRKKWLRPGVVIAAAAIFPLYVGGALLQNSTFGNPRYFVTAGMLVTVAAIWMLFHRDSPAQRSDGLRIATLALLLITVFTATATEMDRRLTVVEGEDHALAMMLGRADPIRRAGADESNLDLVAWKRVTDYVDRRVGPSDVVVSDTNVSFAALVFTKNPSHWLVPEDRRFEQTIALPEPRFEWIVNGRSSAGEAGPYESVFAAIVAAPPEGRQWRKVFSNEVGDVYHLERLSDDGRSS